MPENQQSQTVRLPAPPRPNQHNESGIVKIAGENSIARDFLTAGDRLDAAGVMSHFDDANEVRDVIRLASKLVKFNVTRGIEDLTRYLNMKRGINHLASVYALFGLTGIVSPEALGVPLSKHASKELETLQKEQQRRREREEQQPA